MHHQDLTKINISKGMKALYRDRKRKHNNNENTSESTEIKEKRTKRIPSNKSMETER